MSRALPPNLINISIADLNRAFNSGVDFTSSDTLLRLWKFYSASTTFGNDPVAVRSRNLFWRLLNSPQTAKEIDNIQLAGLWRRCQDDEPFVPIQLPDKFLLLSSIETSEGSSSSIYRSEAGEDVSGNVGSQTVGAKSSTRSPTSLRRSVVSIGSYEREEPSPRTSTISAASNSSRPGLRRNTSSKGRGSTIASNAKGKSKPSLPRRRSSQTRAPSSISQAAPRPALRSPSLAVTTTPPRLGATAERIRDVPVRRIDAASGLPAASSWQSVDEASELPSVANSTMPAARGSLVDPDFRRTFVDGQRHMSSATNLAGLGRGRKTGSSVRFEEVPEVIGKGKGKEQASSPGQESPEALQQRGRSDSQVISESDDSDGVTIMPRVQSNLSKLIKDERKHSGGRELPSTQNSRSREGQSIASRKKAEEEILEMGRKAGAPIIPKGRDLADRMRSPSPGPTF